MDAVLHNADLLRKITESSNTHFVCPMIMYFAGTNREIRQQLNVPGTYLVSNHYVRIKFAPEHELANFAGSIRTVLLRFEQNGRYATLLHGPLYPLESEARIELQDNEDPRTLFYAFISSLREVFQAPPGAKHIRKTEVKDAFYLCTDNANQDGENPPPIMQALQNESHRSLFISRPPYSYMQNA